MGFKRENLIFLEKAHNIYYSKNPPTRDYIVLHKAKNEEGSIGIKSIYYGLKIQEVKYFDLKNNLEIKNFYELIEPTLPYVYLLYIVRHSSYINAMENWNEDNENNFVKCNETLKYLRQLKLQ